MQQKNSREAGIVNAARNLSFLRMKEGFHDCELVNGRDTPWLIFVTIDWILSSDHPSPSISEDQSFQR